MEAKLEWLENPEVFQVGREPAHSDHRYFKNYEDIKNGMEGSYIQGLNGIWKFSYSDTPDSRKADFYKEDYNTTEWKDIMVPGHIQLQGYDRCQYINTMYPWDGKEFLRPPHISKEYNPVGSYVTYFDLSDCIKGQERIYISLQGVETAMYLWLNGQFIGYAEDGFTPSNFEITPYVKEKENKLAIEVYKRSSASWIEDQDFFRFSGIFRDVYLYAEPGLHTKDIFITPGYDAETGSGAFRAELCFSGSALQAPQDKYVVIVVKDQEDNPVFVHKAQVTGDRLSFCHTIESVEPWSSESPYLYTVYVELYEEQILAEVSSLRIGFRTFEMRNGLMCLNGKRIVFKGINRHEFSCDRGRAITKDDMLWDIRFLKQHNINAVRTSHYPNHSYWYDLCDEYGIYLIDETNLESHGSWQKLGACDPSWNVPASRPEWKGVVLDRAVSMLERDKNHASILIWSCGNESYAGEDIAAISEFFHNRDTSRLVHYEGVFWNREYDFISDMESRMYAKPEEIEGYLEQHPKKPYISCEYMHCMGNSCGGLKLYTDLEERYPGYQGGFIWDYIDQSLYREREDGSRVLAYGGDFDDRATDYGFCTNGIVYADRSVSPKAAEVKQLYSNVKLRIQDGWVTIRNENLFRDTSDYVFEVSLLQNGKSIGCYEQECLVEAGDTGGFLIKFPIPAEPGEYVYQVSMKQKTDSLWAAAGHELVFAQETLIRNASHQQKNALDYSILAAHSHRLNSGAGIIYGDVCLGVKGEDFYAQINKAEGGLTSLVKNGKEMITRVPRVSFWRAMTDNDEGNKFHAHSIQWLAASRSAVHSTDRISVEERSDCLRVSIPFVTGAVPLVCYTVTYELYFDGRILVEADYPGYQGDCGPASEHRNGGPMADMPLMAMDFKLKKAFSKVAYYGMGPEENYIDRCNGARLGWFELNPEDNVSGYLKPQECGNRTGIRTMQVTDAAGDGLSFSAVETPFEMSVLPYSVYELDSAMHQEELPSSEYIWVRIIAKQMGVGGDDSWGAPVHSEYRINGNKPMKLRFVIS